MPLFVPGILKKTIVKQILLLFLLVYTGFQPAVASLAPDSIPPVRRYPFPDPAHPLAPPVFPKNTNRITWVAAAQLTAYTGTMIGLYSAWYSQYPMGKMHSFNDWAEWKQMDKIGHVYSAYTAGVISQEMWRWTGIERKKRIWISGMSALAFQTIIETLDGFSTQWGWSWGDVGGNLLGTGLFISQGLAWDEQKIQLKFSAHRKSYGDASLINRSNELFGSGLAERILKDYNGQTYWLSTGIKTWFPKSRIPAWLQVSVGTGADGLFGARENYDTDENGQVVFDRRDLPRYRQWYLAPDIDFSKIRTRKKGIRMLLTALNVVKCPAPALSYGNGKFRFHWFYF